MTLTLALPLLSLPEIHQLFPHFNLGLSLLFFMFSLSAITLSRVSDFIGAFRLLRYAQPISILGLLIVACFQAPWTPFLGFLLMGLGTGCYSSLARALISKYASSHMVVRKAFAAFSLLTVIAPLLSNHITLWLEAFNWHLAFVVMAIIESLLFIAVYRVLRLESSPLQPWSLRSIISGYLHCFQLRSYVVNLVLVGLSASLTISVLIALGPLLLHRASISVTDFSLANLGFVGFYLVGALLFRLFAKLPINSIRIVILSLFLVALLLYFIGGTWLAIWACYLMSFALGVLSPSSTSACMRTIDKHHGAASALLTFGFAFCSAIWAFLYTQLDLNSYHFIGFACVISFVLMVLFSVLSALMP